MSGHSKWSQIKHKKASTDAKRGKIFTKIVKEISVAARTGGGDPEGNPRLRTAIEKAKEVNMPSDNIKKAIMKGTGELPGTTYEEVIYEGYGPGGVALLIETLTDNKNRTVSEVRHILSKNGGSLGEAGCVAWMFEKKGYILVEKSKVDEDTLMSIVLDAGAEDMKNDPKEDNYEIITSPENLNTVKETIEKQNITVSLSEITMLPKSYVPIEGSTAEQMVRLIDALEDNDDVQNVYANFDIPEEAMATASGK
ncbi:MAG: YebC/PmpR family DNA-binding transcriptional regulator [Nitrospiraceae bacterium]|jgi:YebC/PmpR family DNA-binding regulatory protein|nr:YebC/PmpR family DNA-binding transcriptional regulator [Nitrospirota bacterium]MDA8214043.1 YebC/PmpR family DNA-binding transcriptional regulator [Nitrospiraceae bacterium]MDA8339338.1 YebC/PmpR family DNA-binding transcriptional regulator [Nitrospiraceae bacterium]